MRTHSLRHSFLSLWLVYWTFASSLLAHQIERPAQDGTMPIRRRQSDDGFFVVTGITDTSVQPRLEIRQMEQDVDMFNVFLLGLHRFMQVNQTQKLSYYQIAGIHGRPYIPWDGVGPTSGAGSTGYCAHVSNLFLTWHRAYLLLVEQVLFDNVIDVVNGFPAGAVRRRYASAAMRLRLPYWDWATTPADGQNYPSSLQNKTVSVTMPNGTTTIANPLYSYHFHNVSMEDFFFNPYGSWPDTLRDPTNLTDHAVGHNGALEPILDNLRNGIMNRLYNLSTYYSNFTQFGNEAWQTSNVRNSDSLESLHAIIHNIVGNSGHMSYFDYSSFDPVFLSVYTNSTMENRTAVLQTYTIRIGDPEDPTTPLAPFHKSRQGDMYTSLDLWDHRQYAYTYPELTGNATAASVKEAINKLYGGNAAFGGVVARDMTTRVKAPSEVVSKAELEASPGAMIKGRYRNYLANVVSPKFALKGSYAIYVFLGDSCDDPSQWPLSPNLVGVHAVFAGWQKPAAMLHSNLKVSGSVPLTDRLLTKVASAELNSMDPDTVATYLHDNLHWRCASLSDGSMLDAQDLPDLAVTVVSAEIQPATSEDQFPIWSNFTELRRATQGRHPVTGI